MKAYPFADDFLWGAATASYQVEGYPLADGAGPSNWHVFSHKPGTVENDHTGDIGVGQYKLYRDDVQLMKKLGIQAYRFSISWSRIFPEGTGRVNEKGLQYYQNLIDELLANGIQPWATMFHWDLPQALEDKGGWRSKDTARAFGDYVAYVSSKISDRVKNYFTVNEIYCFTRTGYKDGIFAPGLKLDPKTVAQTVHNGCLAHGLAVQAIRANAVQPVNIGLAENMPPTVPVYETEENIAAARTAFRHYSADKLLPMMEGAYADFWLEEMGDNAPEFNDEEMKIISSPIDFVGINVYAPVYIIADADAPHGFREVPLPQGYPRMNMPWLYVGPNITYWAPRFLKEIWDVKGVYVTENGCAAQDKMELDGEVYDTDRVMYLRNHFIAAQRAVSEGIPLKGYFVWSLLDNFEWASGYNKRFGMVYVNYQTLERTPKLSAKFYSEVIKNNAVV
ncbi:MAG: beta-glucosidase [Victivallales bacterium]|nr:beta-glucosidase [Victivallales bacterium]